MFRTIWLLKSFSLFQRMMQNSSRSKPLGLSFPQVKSINKIISINTLAPVFLEGLWFSILICGLKFYKMLGILWWLNIFLKTKDDILEISDKIINIQTFLSRNRNLHWKLHWQYFNVQVLLFHISGYLGFKRIPRTTKSKRKSLQRSSFHLSGGMSPIYILQF